MEERKERSHVLLLPYPAQGHVNPFLQFGKRLVSRGIKITLANIVFINKSARFDAAVTRIGIAFISNGFNGGGYAEAASDEGYVESLKTIGSKTLAELLEKLEGSGQRVSCVVYDSFLPWALDVAKQLGVIGAAFFTQLCIVDADAVYYHVYHGNLAVPLATTMVAKMRQISLRNIWSASKPRARQLYIFGNWQERSAVLSTTRSFLGS